MAECYATAAIRHFEVGEILKEANRLDDAGYHFGICAETAIKNGLQEAGIAAHWSSTNIKNNKNPMKKHWNDLGSSIHALVGDIQTYAQGRRAANIIKYSRDPNLISYFSTWKIDIRYADTTCTPVSATDVSTWESNALAILVELAL